MNNEHEKIYQQEKEILRRLDKIEAKLDKHLQRAAKSETDLEWVKGYIRFNILTVISLIAAVIPIVIKTFF